MANKKKTSTEPTKSLVLGENISQYSLRSSTLQLSFSSSMNDQKELLTFDEDAPISEIIKRLRNIVNCKEIDRSHLSDKKVDRANSLLDVLVFKCTQLTEKALFNAEATLQKNEKNEQNTTFSQFQENFSYSDALRGMRKPHTILVYPAKDSSEATSVEEILKNTIRPEANVKIREFRKVKNQGVAVSCDSVKDIQSIISRLDGDNSAKEKVSHRMPGKRHPSIILYDLPNTITDQEVQEALRTYTEDGENLRTRFKLKGRKPDTSHWVMEAPRQHFLQLKRFRKIAVNWNMFQIKEFFHVKRVSFARGSVIRDKTASTLFQTAEFVQTATVPHIAEAIFNSALIAKRVTEPAVQITTSDIGQQTSAAHATRKKLKPIRRLGITYEHSYPASLF
ncbi:hypothetical protein AVEN_197240-1 [Araneus ventricosus]|uniref:Uncharacterized protein n=1 Tax=Araneus ventricosus TaxID=182803 RepID=A0A4Y2JK47_ARAVE|nr:hypothetical protein AVEN_197240-1 [Araneus ventricosus]